MFRPMERRIRADAGAGTDREARVGRAGPMVRRTPIPSRATTRCRTTHPSATVRTVVPAMRTTPAPTTSAGQRVENPRTFPLDSQRPSSS